MEEDYINTQLKLLSKDNFEYKSNSYYIFLFFNLILNKHGLSLQIPSREFLKKHLIQSLYDLFLVWSCKENERKLKIPEFYKYNITDLKNNKDRYIPFVLILHSEASCSKQDRNSHMMLLLYDKKYEFLELFDSGVYPGGSENYDLNLLINIIKSLFKNELNLNVKDIFLPNQICPKIGIQHLQEFEVINNDIKIIFGKNAGFCSIFSLIYLDKRLEVSNVIEKPKETIQKLLDYTILNKISLTRFIIDYLKELNKLKRHVESTIKDKNIISRIRFIDKIENNGEKTNLILVMIQLINNYFKK